MGSRGASSSFRGGKTTAIDYEERIRDIPEWFLQKSFNSNELYGVRSADTTYVSKETEKAFLANWNGEYGTVRTWVPKSLVSDEAITKRAKQEAAFYKRAQDGLAYNKQLVQFAKSHGVKGARERMTTETLLKKIKAAGLTAPER